MTPVDRPNLGLGIVQPKDALDYFAQKQWLHPSFRWQDVWQQEHAKGVAVAGVMKRDVLQLFADELHATIKAGGDLAGFQKRMEPRLVKKGYWGQVEVKDPITGELRTTTFNASRLALIFDVNNRQAQTAGQWSRLQANKARNPLLRYITRDDGHVREQHAAWHNLVLPIDHPFWQEHYPPNGWRCRCRVVALSEKDFREAIARGDKLSTTAPPEQLAPYKNPHTGEIRLVPVGIDPGFAYNPGIRPFAGLAMRELDSAALQAVAALGPSSLRMPPPRPVSAAQLLPAGLRPEEYLAQFIDALGNKPEQIDPTGERFAVTDEFFRTISGELKIMKRGRERFVRLIAKALLEPDEIWLETMRHVARNREVMRRRYVARFEIEGEVRPMLAVLELGDDGWVGRTGYQSEIVGEDEAMLAGARRGERLYVRPDVRQT